MTEGGWFIQWASSLVIAKSSPIRLNTQRICLSFMPLVLQPVSQPMLISVISGNSRDLWQLPRSETTSSRH